jgi:hypothetical protein
MKTKTQNNTLHMSVNFRFFDLQSDEMIKKWIKDGVLKGPNIKTPGDVRESIAAMRADGLECFPTCDNVDQKGYCMGHQKMEGK